MTPRGNIVFTHVTELTDAESRTWDEELLHNLFWSVDVQRILNIPLSRRGVEDVVSWHFNRNGIFSVKSAYHIEWDYQLGREMRRTNLYGSAHTSPVWKTLWAMRVPEKIKINCWRSLMGAIPCLEILANRHM
jgi:hypothetical protein